MQVFHSLPIEYADAKSSQTIGFVPTMGYLHEGHLSLIKQARQKCDLVVLSIFVNPLQFGPNEDYDRYPRHPERDLQLAEQAGVDVVFMPDVDVMYPKPMHTMVQVSGVSEGLCGASRPGHFSGVATVVLKLLNMIKPHKVFFGMKDAQQVAVIRTMVEDLNVDVQVIACPTLREQDGLAMSSRNVYLSEEERRQAPILYTALSEARSIIEDQAGKITIDKVYKRIKERIESAQLAVIDYIEIVTYPTLEPIEASTHFAAALEQSDVLIAVAVKFGETRLIDNIMLTGGKKDV